MDLNVMGPLARTAEDLEMMLDASLRFGGMRLGGMNDIPGARLDDAGPVDLHTLRVGLWLDDPVAPVDSVTRSTVEAFVEQLESAGAVIDPGARPAASSSDLHDTYGRLLTPVMSAGLPASVMEPLAAVADAIDGPLDAGDPATFVDRNARDSLASHIAWLSANERRAQAQVAWNDVFDSVDVMLMPVSQTQAFAHDTERSYRDRSVIVDRGADHPSDRAYHELLFWAGLATMPLLPSIVMPLGPVNGLPLGVQMVGPRWSDRRLLRLASAISDVCQLRFTPPTVITG
jgi:amidase